MPNGIIKTPIAERAKDAKVPNSTERTGSGGKKLVQTRLPFKLIEPAAASPSATVKAATTTTTTTVPTAATKDEVPIKEIRKRKLSYNPENGCDSTDDVSHLRRSNSKENMAVDMAAPAATVAATTTSPVDSCKKLKTSESAAVELIELIDDDDNDCNKPETKGKSKKLKEAPSKNGKNSPLIQIKLPLKNKRTTRSKKSEQNKVKPKLDKTKDVSIDAGNSSDDIEAVALELNPQKRSKKSEQNKVKPKLDKTKDVGIDAGNSSDDIEAVALELNPQKRSKKSKQNKVKPKLDKTKDVSINAGNSSDDIEAVALELNPQKRLRVQKSSVATAAPSESTETKKTEPSTAEQKTELNADSKEHVAEAHDSAGSGSETKPILKPQASSDSDNKKSNEIEQFSTEMEVDTDTPNVSLQEQSKTLSDKKTIEIEPSSTDMEVDTDAANVSLTPSNNQAKTDKNKSEQVLTPKQQKLLEQRRKAREEKERKLQEERRQKQMEKEEREQAKKREREQKEEQRRKERNDKEEERRREREEKERKRQAEVETKNEEKRKRNEAKEEVQRKKDEERRRKEQEKEEAEQKKKRAAESFTKFFVQKQPKGAATNYEHDQNSCDSTRSCNQSERKLAFRPFQIKDDMLVAPATRARLLVQQRAILDRLLGASTQDDADEEDEDIVRRKTATRAQLYLNELRLGQHKAQRVKRDITLNKCTKDEEDDDVQVIDDDLCNAGMPIMEEQSKRLPRMRAKYIHFADNRRPPYYGTWRKQSKLVTARRPLAQDKNWFDYEVDSDCEWEEEEPGESLSASEDEKERESDEEDYEVDNEWFVPHGHLSDEEMQNDGEMEDGNTREAQKAKLQVLQQEFAQEMKKQTKKIKPRLLGPVWLDENGNKSQTCPALFTQFIGLYKCWSRGTIKIEPPLEIHKNEELSEEKPATLALNDTLLQQLVRLIHGNGNAKVFLVSEYLEYLKTQTDLSLPSKTLIREKIDEYAVWKPVELGTAEQQNSKKAKKPKKRLCWVVSAAVLAKFQLEELTLENQWNYTLTPKTSKSEMLLRDEKDTDTNATKSPTDNKLANTTTNSSSKTKKADSKQNNTKLQEPLAAVTPASNKTAAPKKRVNLLMSVPRDQQIHTATKNALISQFLKKSSADAKARKEAVAATTDTSAPIEDVVLLSD